MVINFQALLPGPRSRFAAMTKFNMNFGQWRTTESKTLRMDGKKASDLRQAASAGNMYELKLLLSEGGNPSAPDPACNACTPLHAAVLGGHFDAVRQTNLSPHRTTQLDGLYPYPYPIHILYPYQRLSLLTFWTIL